MANPHERFKAQERREEEHTKDLRKGINKFDFNVIGVKVTKNNIGNEIKRSPYNVQNN